MKAIKQVMKKDHEPVPCSETGTGCHTDQVYVEGWHFSRWNPVF